MWRPGERRAVGPMTASLSFARPVVPTSGKGRGRFRPRARYFPGMESTQRSPGLRTRTRGARLERGLNLFGAGMNLGPFRSPPAAARTGQIRWPFFPHIAPLVRLSFSAPLGGGAPGTQPRPNVVVVVGRGGARECSEGCPRLGTLRGVDFATTRRVGGYKNFPARAEPLPYGKALQERPLIRPFGPPSPMGGEGFFPGGPYGGVGALPPLI